MPQKHNQIRPDNDIPEMTAADFARAKPLRSAMPEVVDAMKRGRGRPKSPDPKQRVSLRLDSPVVAAWKATGAGWQSRINEVLAAAAPKRSYKHMSKSKGDIYIERRPEGDYAVRKEHSRRASVVAPTQADAIEKAREMFPGVRPDVERVRRTSGGKPDKWRKA
jgi:uncharacterized protein (DUF4415 family)